MPHDNAAGIALIKQFEGCDLTAYQDGGGIWTIGWGHATDVHEGDKISQAEADALLQQDVESAALIVANSVEVVLTPNEFAALVSFEYNTGALTTSPGLALINRKQFQPAWDDHFCLYIHDANGNVEPGLITRRAAERALFFTP